MSVRSYFFNFIIVFCALFSSIVKAAETPTKYTSPEDFLKQQKTIRVIANKYIGYGDITAAANVMQQVRSLGFNGKFEVVYNDKKAASLIFNLPADIPDTYDDVKSNARFIDVSKFLTLTVNHQVKPVDFSITSMGWDNACELIINEGRSNQELAKKMKDTLICQNNANFLNSKMFYQFSNWPMPLFSDLYLDDQYQMLNDAAPTSVKNDQTYFVTPTATLDQVIDYLEHDPQGILIADKIPALKYFATAAQQQEFDVMPIYGHGIQPDSNWASTMRNLLSIIAGARYAQLNGPASLSEKPLIIAAFYDYHDEEKVLNQIIKEDNFDAVMHSKFGNWSEQEVNQAREMIKQLGLNNVVTTTNLTDPDALAILQNLKPGQILILGTGPLPKIVFDGIFTYAGPNAWPQVREGASSASSLLLTGKPHFRCGVGNPVANEGGEWEMKIDYLNTDKLLIDQLTDFYGNSGFCTATNVATIYKKLGDLLIQAHDENSSFSQYFKSIKADASKTENNRVYQDLLTVIKVFNQNIY